MRNYCIPVCLFLAALYAPVNADTYTWDGDTTESPTWRRPTVAFTGYGAGSDQHYDVLHFIVTTPGSYGMEMLSNTREGGGIWDAFFHLYKDSFDPAAPFTNGVVGADEGGSAYGLPKINGVALATGTDYFLVTSGYMAVDYGPYRNAISGPGGITPLSGEIPEPGTLALVGLGLVGLVLRARRRRA